MQNSPVSPDGTPPTPKLSRMTASFSSRRKRSVPAEAPLNQLEQCHTAIQSIIKHGFRLSLRADIGYQTIVLHNPRTG